MLGGILCSRGEDAGDGICRRGSGTVFGGGCWFGVFFSFLNF